jgi:hypothetical protein
MSKCNQAIVLIFFMQAKFYSESCSEILKVVCNEGVGLSDSRDLQVAVGEVIDRAK